MKKNKIMSFTATGRGLEIITLSEVSQEEKDKIPHDATCVWSLKYGANALTREVDTWLQGAGGGLGVGKEGLGGWNRRQKPLYAQWLDKAILRSTGNCLQHPVPNHSGKESFKVCINKHQKCPDCVWWQELDRL